MLNFELSHLLPSLMQLHSHAVFIIKTFNYQILSFNNQKLHKNGNKCGSKKTNAIER
jgi:hypothetical protein